MDNVQLMTYAQAAEVMKIQIDSVKRRARNRRWHRELGNDGLVRIAVPLTALPDPSVNVDPEYPPEYPGDRIEAEKRIVALEVEVAMLRETLQDLRAERDAWRASASHRWWHIFIRPSHQNRD
jgi:predicted SAM-dependent methyltransferase